MMASVSLALTLSLSLRSVARFLTRPISRSLSLPASTVDPSRLIPPSSPNLKINAH